MREEEVDSAAKAYMRKIGQKLVKKAKEKCPVKTGRLRDSIRIMKVDEDTVIVGSNVEYALEVERGTSKRAAKPFLRPALYSATKDLV